MKALQCISKTMEGYGNTVRETELSVHEFKKTTAMRAYRKHLDGVDTTGNRIESRILCAVTRWLSTGDVRIEFYSDSTSGDLRVKVIDEGGAHTRDMSLTNFVGSSPSTN